MPNISIEDVDAAAEDEATVVLLEGALEVRAGRRG